MIAIEALHKGRPEGSRVALRPLTPADADQLFPLLNDWQVVKMLSEVPWPLTPADVETYTARQGEPDAASEDFAIIVAGRAVGVCGVKKPGSGDPPRKMPRLGYWIGRPFWSQGIATEAVRILVAHAFARFPHEVVGAGVFVDNLASRRLLEKLGFSVVARGESLSRSRGALVPTVDMRVTRERWHAVVQGAG
jgi:8-oxo-dGTP diphosphatase